MFLLDFFIDSVPKPDLVLQKVFPLMQEEHGDAMEKSEWVHEGLISCCNVNVTLVLIRPNGGCFINIWTKHMASKCNWVDLSILLFIMGVSDNKTTLLRMFIF
jgi:hypothetical protein